MIIVPTHNRPPVICKGEWFARRHAFELLLNQAADSGVLGCLAGSLFQFSTLSYSEEIFLQLVVIHTTQLVVNLTLLSLHCAIKH